MAVDASTRRTAEGHYSALQITLHWAIVVLVIVQFLSHESMKDFWDRLEDGATTRLPDDPGALVHALSGGVILVLMLVRIVVRLRHGAPPAPSDLHPLLKLAGHANHLALYALLVILPLTGAAAVLLGIEAAAEVHSLLVPLLWGLVILHVLAALYHAAIRRDGVFQRMIAPR